MFKGKTNTNGVYLPILLRNPAHILIGIGTAEQNISLGLCVLILAPVANVWLKCFLWIFIQSYIIMSFKIKDVVPFFYSKY